jgi:hypothetical protein
MPFRQIDLSQISTANSSNNQVIAVVANTIVWANVTASGGSANPLATSIVGLNTANVTESTSNLYFTNTRAIGAFVAGSGINIAANGQISASASSSATSIVGLNTANVTESTSNLYFTNARVYSNIVTTLETYNGNINAGNIITGGATGGSLTGANLISANNISSLNWIGLYTANVIETASNLYFTNARVYSNVLALLPTLAGDNITIAANGRISSTASGSGSVLATSIIGLNTANVSESVSNLYYTNARVYSNIVSTLATYTGNIFGGNLTTGGALGGSITGANLISANNFISTGGTITGANLISANNITTTNLYTGSNGSGGSITGANLISANNVIATNITTTNLYTGSNGAGGSITGANLISANNISATNWLNLYTANVIETAGNLYFTNTRVYSNVISLLPTYTGNLSVGNLNVTGGITDAVGILSIATIGGTNANIELTANGTGRIGLDGMYWPNADGTAGQILQTSGTGDLSWTTPSAGGGGSGLFNSSITSSNNYLATSTLSNAIVFSTQSILHSVYITNIDTVGSANIGVTATILGGGTNAPMLFNMPLPYRSSFEALKKPKVVNAGDAIQIQGLENGVGANNDVHATIVYEEITSGTYTGINSNIAIPYANVDIFTAASASIIESVMVSSTNNLGNIPITVTITNSSNVIQGYMAYTLLVPVGATIELCEKPRRIASGHKIQAYTNSANAIAIFVAAKAV